MDWGALLSTFGLIFVAELGDKTQLAIVAQTCKYQSPWPVFLGGSLALTAVTALGVLGGQVLVALVPPALLRLTAAAAFVVMGLLIWREATRPGASEAGDDVCGCDGPPRVWNWQAFSSTLALLFVAELGDKTQLAVLGLSSQQAAPWLVFAGGALALAAVTALGVAGGQQLCRLITQQLLLKVSGVAFVAMGGLMGLGAF